MLRFGLAWLVLALAAAASPPARADEQGFDFGSYGRITAGTDLRGGDPDPVRIVRYAPRIIEPTYLELDLYYRREGLRNIDLRSVATFAFGDALFHDTGRFEAELAIRNLYLEAVICEQIGVWIGSRMERGDDIYLLDAWPLDDLNTVGAGTWWRSHALELRGLVGKNRLDDPFQSQTVTVADPEFGAAEIEQLDRQRLIASASASYRFWGAPGGPAAKLKAYADVQGLPEGRFRRDDQTFEDLPADVGWAGGLQLGAWGFGPGHSHANLFVRFGHGLGAFDELAIPSGLDADKRAFPGATELILGASGAYAAPRAGALWGAYARRFVDADPNRADRDDGWEYAIDVRPYAPILDVLQVAVDLSYQRRLPRGASPDRVQILEPAALQIAPMLVFTPSGPGPFQRPHLRLVYRAAHLNAGARDEIPRDSPARDRGWRHFLGFQAEWWWNSSTYGRP